MIGAMFFWTEALLIRRAGGSLDGRRRWRLAGGAVELWAGRARTLL